MAKIQPFEDHIKRYEEWFVKNRYAYESELQAVHMLLPQTGTGVEIGVGSGRFAAPLGIRCGVEPSPRMRVIALEKGIEALDGIAESLPYRDSTFDFALMVTTICFLDNVEKALEEAYRVIIPGGCLIIGFVDRESALGTFYLEHREESVFYKIAEFYSTSEVSRYLKQAGFTDLSFAQTIFHALSEIREIEPVKRGYGEGSFVVARGTK